MGQFPQDIIDKAMKRANNQCEGKNHVKGLKPTALQAHHKKPAEDGGKDTIDNCEILCKVCHAKKHPDVKNLIRS
jgi:5-methylcytosine-specific restriction endonuclease McrA